MKVSRAIISVYDKSGIDVLAEELALSGVEIVATGSTCSYLRDLGYDVTEVSSYTGFPEILGGRVKTLHPKVHGGILSRGRRIVRS